MPASTPFVPLGHAGAGAAAVAEGERVADERTHSPPSAGGIVTPTLFGSQSGAERAGAECHCIVDGDLLASAVLHYREIAC
jgi:hypothetical protein